MPLRTRRALQAEVASAYPGIFTNTETIRSHGRGNRRASQELFSTVGLNSAAISSLNERADSDLEEEVAHSSVSPDDASRPSRARRDAARKESAAEGERQAQRNPDKGAEKSQRRQSDHVRSTDRTANAKALIRYMANEAYKAHTGKQDHRFDARTWINSTAYVPAPPRRLQVVLKEKPALIVFALFLCVSAVVGVVVQLARTVYGVYWLVFKPILFLLGLTWRLAVYLLETLSVGSALYCLASLPDLFASYAREGDWRRAYLYASPQMNLADIEGPEGEGAGEGAGEGEDCDGADGEGRAKPGEQQRVTLTQMVGSLFSLQPEDYLIFLRCSRVTSTFPELVLSRIFCAGVDVFVPPFPEDNLERAIWCAQILRFSLDYAIRYFAEVYYTVVRLLCSSWAFVRGAQDRLLAACVAVTTGLALYSPLAPLLSIPLLGRLVLALRTASFVLLFVVNVIRIMRWQYRTWLRPLVRPEAGGE